MIRSVQIRNFRSFDAATLQDCRRINVIVGENGSGKTALLQAIFLAAGPVKSAFFAANRTYSGVETIAAVLLSIPAQPGGVVLVDEIENGIHYKRLPLIWRSIFELAKEHDAQVFVTTHSDECLAAIAEIAEEESSQISVIHARLREGATELTQYDGKTFLDAMEENIEIR